MSKKDGLLSNLLWKFAERMAAQIITFIVSIILARILEPSHYGIISIVIIFITLANVLVSDGFGSALIQKKETDALDFSSVLYFNIFFSVILYIITFFSAPFIADFFGEGYEVLAPVLRVLGLRVIISGINSVQQAYVSRNMVFRKFFWATLSGTILSAIIGIWMAYSGYGVWALVAQYLTNTTVGTIVLGISLHKKPKLAFSVGRLKEMLGYGLRILGASILIIGFVELRGLIIGRMYSAENLAFYDRGRQFPNLIVANINTSIGAVLFPKMSKEQDDKLAVKNTTKSSVRFSAYLMCPMMLGLAAVAKPLVSLVLTDKWLPCVPLLQLFCIVYLFQPIHTANMQAIKAVGRSDTYLKLEIIKKAIELIMLVIVMWISVQAIVASMAILTTAFTFLNAFPNIKYLGYSFKEQMLDILPPLAMAGIMSIIVCYIQYVPMPILPTLTLQIFSGAVIYCILSIVTKNREFLFVLSLIKSKTMIISKS